MGWIFDFYREKFEEGKKQGKDLKKKHKKKIKGIFKKDEEDEES